MVRMRLHRQKKFDRLTRFFITLFAIFIGTIFLLYFISRQISPVLLNYAQIEAGKFANLIINKAITKQVASGIDMDKLFVLVQNKDGEIQTIDFNPIIVNKALNLITSIVQSNLRAIQMGRIESLEISDDILAQYDKNNLKRGIIYEIPLGVITNNVFLSNLGPRIPVRLSLIGSVLSNINTKINPYGINNALIEVVVHISVTEQVNLPMMSKKINVQSDIPVAMKIIEGKIPQYYQASGLEKNSSILALPIQ